MNVKKKKGILTRVLIVLLRFGLKILGEEIEKIDSRD